MTTDTRLPLPPREDARGSDGEGRPKVHIASYGGSHAGRGALHADIHGLDSRELDLIQGAMHGCQWVTCKNGRIEHVPAYEKLPGPLEDEVMLPFWRRPAEGAQTQMSLFSLGPLPAWSSPCITIGSLCGYNYSAKNYERNAANLMRWGFVCLRSQRDNAGKFYEHWHLPGLWAAKEELKAAVDALDPYLDASKAEEFLRNALSSTEDPGPPKSEEERQKRALEAAVRFLCRNASFGTLDVSVQRAAMVID